MVYLHVVFIGSVARPGNLGIPIFKVITSGSSSSVIFFNSQEVRNPRENLSSGIKKLHKAKSKINLSL